MATSCYDQISHSSLNNCIEGPRIVEIVQGPNGFGFEISACANDDDDVDIIFIKSVKKPEGQKGDLIIGDRILRINNVEVTSQRGALDCFKSSGSKMILCVRNEPQNFKRKYFRLEITYLNRKFSIVIHKYLHIIELFQNPKQGFQDQAVPDGGYLRYPLTPVKYGNSPVHTVCSYCHANIRTNVIENENRNCIFGLIFCLYG